MPIPDAGPLDISSLDFADLQSALQDAMLAPLDVSALQAVLEDKSLMATTSLDAVDSLPADSAQATANNEVQRTDSASLDTTFGELQQMLGDLQSPANDPSSVDALRVEQLFATVPDLLPTLDQMQEQLGQLFDTDAQTGSLSYEVVFIQAGLEDSDSLIADLQWQAAAVRTL